MFLVICCIPNINEVCQHSSSSQLVGGTPEDKEIRGTKVCDEVLKSCCQISQKNQHAPYCHSTYSYRVALMTPIDKIDDRIYNVNVT